MHLVPFIVLVVAALAAFLDWYVTTPRRFASHALALFLFIVGMILVFVVTGDPHISIGD